MVSLGCINIGKAAQNKFYLLFGSGFSGTSGQTDNFTIKAAAIIGTDSAISLQSISHHDLPHRRHIFKQAGDNRHRTPLLDYLFNKIMPVKLFTFNRDKGTSLMGFPAVCNNFANIGINHVRG